MATQALTVGQKLIGAIKARAGTAVGVGIALIVAGVFSICAPFAAGLSVMLMIGGLLLLGGVALLLLALKVGAFSHGLPLFLMGLLMLVAGIYTFSQPVAALASMTVLLSAYFIVTGAIELIAGFRARPIPGSGWMVAGGLVTLLLGVMLWRQSPLSGAWAVGTLFGVKLLMTGITMTSIGMMVRRDASDMGAAL